MNSSKLIGLQFSLFLWALIISNWRMITLQYSPLIVHESTNREILVVTWLFISHLIGRLCWIWIIHNNYIENFKWGKGWVNSFWLQLKKVWRVLKGKKNVVFFVGATIEVFREQLTWLSPNTLSTIVHGLAFHIKILQPPSHWNGSLYPRSRDTLSSSVGLSRGNLHQYPVSYNK